MIVLRAGKLRSRRNVLIVDNFITFAFILFIVFAIILIVIGVIMEWIKQI